MAEKLPERPTGGLASSEEHILNMQIIKHQLNKGELIINNQLFDINMSQANWLLILYDENHEEYIAKISFSTEIIYIVYNKDLKPISFELYNKLYSK